MASSSNDPTTGAPIYLDSDAPDPAVNPTQVAAYAASVGNRLIGTTAERTAYTYAREGLEWYDTTLDEVYLHNGTGWVLWHKAPTTYTPTLTNWGAGAGTVVGRYEVASGLVQFQVDVILGAGFSATGPFYVGVPVTADTGVQHVGGFFAQNVGARHTGVVGLDNSSRLWMLRSDNNFLSNTAWTWASGNRVSLSGAYRPV